MFNKNKRSIESIRTYKPGARTMRQKDQAKLTKKKTYRQQEKRGGSRVRIYILTNVRKIVFGIKGVRQKPK